MIHSSLPSSRSHTLESMRIFKRALVLPAPGGTGLAVPEVHDVHGGLMPPIEHEHDQDVPQLMTGSKIVHLTCTGRKGSWGL